jgi:hypothetical protein
MKRIVGYSVVVVLLSAIPAAMCLAYGLYEREMARAGEAFAVFDFDVAATTAESVDRSLGYADIVPWFGGALRADAQRRAAEARYWQGAYSALAAAAERQTREDPQLRFMVANANFRKATSDPDRRAALEALDAAILGYKQTLEGAPDHLRAAFNYEYGLRVRKTITHPVPLQASNIHGLEGSSPKSSGMENVNILIPLQAGEGPKKGGTEAGKGVPKRKRG